MRKYNFMGKDASEEEFWELCSTASLEELEQKLFVFDKKKIQEVLEGVKYSFEDKSEEKLVLKKIPNRALWRCVSTGRLFALTLKS